jgi:hypothetical protein
MNQRAPGRESSGRIHFIAIIVVTIVVMVLGVLVVAFPGPMGVPQAPATPPATATATPAP